MVTSLVSVPSLRLRPRLSRSKSCEFEPSSLHALLVSPIPSVQVHYRIVAERDTPTLYHLPSEECLTLHAQLANLRSVTQTELVIGLECCLEGSTCLKGCCEIQDIL